ncbi:Hypothetical protein, putative [Bodo saltans]|uniref:Uncharacterized protein n=1 Tax=Bodo saltans TaxID=75058 RepID=A0A0S4ING2_BODSA|nr:Hypothetical protein, putative [Bodo saltans]|eukprot:CUE71286.1 Hypothetical protein, putative [Bodo saltans]
MSITQADIHLDAIISEEKRVAQLIKKAAEKRIEFEQAEQEANDARTALEWRRLLRRIEDDQVLKMASETMRSAVLQFENSFREPHNYENDEGVEYTATDDFADFTTVDGCADRLLDTMHEQLEVQRNTDRAVLLLVIVTVEVGRALENALSGDARFAGAPVGEIEDCRDSLVTEWQQLFFAEGSGPLGSGALSLVDATRWHSVVSTHLGAPFDSAPTA